MPVKFFEPTGLFYIQSYYIINTKQNLLEIPTGSILWAYSQLIQLTEAFTVAVVFIAIINIIWGSKLVSYGFYNRLLQPQWLKIMQIYYLTLGMLEVRLGSHQAKIRAWADPREESFPCLFWCPHCLAHGSFPTSLKPALADQVLPKLHHLYLSSKVTYSSELTSLASLFHF